MSNSSETFWQNVDELREERGYSWSRLARESGIDRVSLTHAKSYKNSPQLDRVLKLAEVLEVSVDELTKVRGSSVG